MHHSQSRITGTRVREEPFDVVIIALHWATALMVLTMVLSVLAIGYADDAGTAGRLLTVHRSLGLSIWVLTCCRLVWRRTRAKLPAWPDTMGRAQRWLAQLNEYGLYGLLLIQPCTGLFQSLYTGRPFGLFNLSVPVIFARNVEAIQRLGRLHAYGAWMLAALVGLHSAAALLHFVVFKDGVLESMMPISGRAGRTVLSRPRARHGAGRTTSA